MLNNGYIITMAILQQNRRCNTVLLFIVYCCACTAIGASVFANEDSQAQAKLTFVPADYIGPGNLNWGMEPYSLRDQDSQRLIVSYYQDNAQIRLHVWDIERSEVVWETTYDSSRLVGITLTANRIVIVLDTSIVLLNHQYQLEREVFYPEEHGNRFYSIRDVDFAVSPDGDYIFIKGMLWDNRQQQWFDLQSHIAPRSPIHVLSHQFMVTQDFWERCARVTALQSLNTTRKVCIPLPGLSGLLGLTIHTIWGMSFLDDKHLWAYYGDDKSCLFNLETLKRLHCWKRKFMVMSGELNRGLTTDAQGRWILYQMYPKQVIAKGTLQHEPEAALVGGSPELAVMVDKVKGEIVTLDLQTGTLLGQQQLEVLKEADYERDWLFIGDVLSVLTASGWQGFNMQTNQENSPDSRSDE